MEVILLAAGLSQRFPNMRPKYTLTDYIGNMMIENSFKPYLGKFPITVGILQEHHDQYPIAGYLQEKYGDDLNIVYLKHRTHGPAETAREILRLANINPAQAILIKDCDSFFKHQDHDGNYVCTTSIQEHEVLKRLSSKSFVVANNQNIITDIIEKQVISDTFCVGGYRFESAELFMKVYDQLVLDDYKEIFVSHIIQHCLAQGEIFTSQPVQDYVDVGTAQDWFDYNNKSVLFCDIDGTIVEAQAREDFGKPLTPLVKSCKRLQHLVSQGHQLVFTTARPSSRHQELTKLLEDIGFTNFQLITGLLNTPRILINDYNEANPYPRASAINVKRDSDTLGDFL